MNTPGPTPAIAAPTRARVVLTKSIVRLTEIALILVGLGFIVISDDDELAYLAIWDLLALTYLGIGVIVLRRTRRQPNRTQDITLAMTPRTFSRVA